ncbi:hypothetical protein GIB67_005167 [Kingdonia uniflora]|uniref:Uncharacterized protein n=1 Tax=Kingdonia uniflora TaxID=39325 RepID=A0A7J7NMZ5_9MAGN|nr:hypothetical protein GIB67_005167 [Kingdonia uniflora]
MAVLVAMLMLLVLLLTPSYSEESFDVRQHLSTVSRSMYAITKALGYIASAIGKPICLDNATDTKARMAFAKVCVEITLDHTLPSSILVDRGDGVLAEIKFTQVWQKNELVKIQSQLIKK